MGAWSRSSLFRMQFLPGIVLTAGRSVRKARQNKFLTQVPGPERKVKASHQFYNKNLLPKVRRKIGVCGVSRRPENDRAILPHFGRPWRHWTPLVPPSAPGPLRRHHVAGRCSRPWIPPSGHRRPKHPSAFPEINREPLASSGVLERFGAS